MDRNAIGDAAGKVWRALGAQERVALNGLAKAANMDASLAALAAGWLAREDKIEFEKQGRTVYVRLAPGEAELYRGTTNP